MKRLTLILFALVVSSSLFWSCGGKEIAEIKKLETYQDPVVKFEVQYPDNWLTFKQPSARFICYSSQGVKQRYPSYETIGKAGAKIEILVTALDSNMTIDTVLENRTFEKTYYSDPEIVTIDGVQGFKETYGFELEDGPFYGERYIVTKDGQVATQIYIEAFAGTFDDYKKSFQEIIGSIKLAVKPKEKSSDTLNVEVEADPPSESFRSVTVEGATINIPDNFNKEGGMYMGARRGDCYIKVDFLDASKSTDFAKMVKEASSNLPGASTAKDMSLNGEKAKLVTYKPSGKVAGEIYFVLKNKKLWRVTLNWFSGDKDEEKLFKPIFQKCALTFKAP